MYGQDSWSDSQQTRVKREPRARAACAAAWPFRDGSRRPHLAIRQSFANHRFFVVIVFRAPVIQAHFGVEHEFHRATLRSDPHRSFFKSTLAESGTVEPGFYGS